MWRLVDVQMPDGSGLDVVRGAVGLWTRIIMLTTFDLDEYVNEALRHGCGGIPVEECFGSGGDAGSSGGHCRA